MLTQFTERPAIREAWAANKAKVRLPFNAKEQPCLAPSCGNYQSSVGTAFDYLARFRLARDLLVTPGFEHVAIHDCGWAAEDSVSCMEGHPKFATWHRRWAFLVSKARELHDDFLAGRELSVERMARCCQYLAAADLLLRIDGFNPNFKDRPEVQVELLALSAAFDPVRMFAPRHSVMLNPTFLDSWRVGGADADLIVDNTIVDIKTTSEMAVSASHLRQLAGYAILHRMGGPQMAEDAPEALPIDTVGIYFSRFGCLATWRLEELLPGDALQRFTDAFLDELPSFQKEQGIVRPHWATDPVRPHAIALA